jgi:hypothetical protein
MSSLNFLHRHNRKYFQHLDRIIEKETGHFWLIQKKSQLFGNPHFYLKRVQNGYDPGLYHTLGKRGADAL